jgi:hypothetical protein
MLTSTYYNITHTFCMNITISHILITISPIVACHAPSPRTVWYSVTYAIQNDEYASSHHAVILHCFNTNVVMSKRPSTLNLFIHIRVMHGYPIRRLPVPVPETADHGAGTGREMRARVRVRIVNFHVLTRLRVFAQRLPYSAQYVDGVAGTLKGTHNLYQQKALARWIQLTLILTPQKIHRG